jgi:hypothetical protein
MKLTSGPLYCQAAETLPELAYEPLMKTGTATASPPHASCAAGD